MAVYFLVAVRASRFFLLRVPDAGLPCPGPGASPLPPPCIQPETHRGPTGPSGLGCWSVWPAHHAGFHDRRLFTQL